MIIDKVEMRSATPSPNGTRQYRMEDAAMSIVANTKAARGDSRLSIVTKPFTGAMKCRERGTAARNAPMPNMSH